MQWSFSSLVSQVFTSVISVPSMIFVFASVGLLLWQEVCVKNSHNYISFSLERIPTKLHADIRRSAWLFFYRPHEVSMGDKEWHILTTTGWIGTKSAVDIWGFFHFSSTSKTNGIPLILAVLCIYCQMATHSNKIVNGVQTTHSLWVVTGWFMLS